MTEQLERYLQLRKSVSSDEVIEAIRELFNDSSFQIMANGNGHGHAWRESLDKKINELGGQPPLVVPEIDRDYIVTFYESQAAFHCHMQVTGKGLQSDIHHNGKYHEALAQAKFWREHSAVEAFTEYDENGRRLD